MIYGLDKVLQLLVLLLPPELFVKKSTFLVVGKPDMFRHSYSIFF